MSSEHRYSVSPAAAAAAAVSLLLAGAGATYLVMRDRPRLLQPSGADTSAPPMQAASPQPDRDRAAARSDVIVTLTQEAVRRAGIAVSRASTQTVADAIRFPGVVQPNAYRQVAVTPLVTGRIVRVPVQLGDRVRRGQPVAQLYSPDLADARTTYVAAKAMLDAHDRELQRTQKLAAIGAASRQELERIHAEHAAQLAGVERARSRLELLGAPGEDASPSSAAAATTNVVAPIDGVITERTANAGMNVDPTTRLVTIVDLSSVWVVASVYENDLRRVREGARATVTTDAYPGLTLEGRVSYIDPQLDAATRTAGVRVEVANPRGDLRIGMYTNVAIEVAGGASVVSVPRIAIQTVGDRQVVYLQPSDDGTRFVEREVRVGGSSGDLVEILAGLSAGDRVVSAGSFFVRAEAERLGLRAPQAGVPAERQAPSGQRAGEPTASVQAAKILVTDKGFEPETVRLQSGRPARLTFVRISDKSCATEVVFPSLNIRRALPLNEPVTIELAAASSGSIAFVCGMSMLKGAIAVE
jgi:RND family efflux transporter MFP subunit